MRWRNVRGNLMSACHLFVVYFRLIHMYKGLPCVLVYSSIIQRRYIKLFLNGLKDFEQMLLKVACTVFVSESLAINENVSWYQTSAGTRFSQNLAYATIPIHPSFHISIHPFIHPFNYSLSFSISFFIRHTLFSSFFYLLLFITSLLTRILYFFSVVPTKVNWIWMPTRLARGRKAFLAP